jgi:hypothetical protein
MLPDDVRMRVAELLQVIAEARVTVGLCNRRDEVEVCIGDVTPYLAGLEWGGSHIEERGERRVFVDQLGSGFRLVCVSESEDQLGDMVGAAHSIRAELESILRGDPPESPARAAAMKVGAA